MIGSKSQPLDVVSVHREHSEFVWRTLQRLGVRPPDLEDRFQDVFVVVHRRLSSFRAESQVTSWLFGICVRVVAAHRRRAWFRREQPDPNPPDAEGPPHDRPDAMLAARQAQAELDRVLEKMDLEKRAVLVMFEVDELASEQIATLLGVPIGTVWSRLSAARKQFQKILLRQRAARGDLTCMNQSAGETTAHVKPVTSFASPRRPAP